MDLTQLTSLEYILIVSTILEFNPILQTLKAVKRKSVEDISLGTFLSIFVIGSMWLYYGITISNTPLIIGNAIKLLSSLTVLVIYFQYKSKSGK